MRGISLIELFESVCSFVYLTYNRPHPKVNVISENPMMWPQWPALCVSGMTHSFTAILSIQEGQLMLQITRPLSSVARIQKARTALLLDHPFFGTLLFRLGARALTSIATMATDGVSLYFNPEFVDSLSSAELIGVLAHETMHPALQHAGNEEAYAEIAKNVPIRRAGRPEEIASAVLWLCSPGASYVVGHALTVDGGMTVV
jgi:hypothetical protein